MARLARIRTSLRLSGKVSPGPTLDPVGPWSVARHDRERGEIMKLEIVFRQDLSPGKCGAKRWRGGRKERHYSLKSPTRLSD
ncbi:MAG: hypothetical protein ABSH41_19265 [Syntrophobacteraceae bacterium]